MLGQHKITNIFYYVSDLDRTEVFWRDGVGLEVMRVEDGGHAFLTAPTAGGVDLLFFEGEVKAGNCPMIVFDLADGGIDAVLDGLLTQGAALMTPVSHAPGGWSAEVTDPDGHIVSIYQSGELPR
ncbi:VOC family protein [Pelagovum pacificum]|uniref:VOC family protein n=1 Tax=Pelagovum pacificum TaxID=2588711 RepID=A0A5C5G933_9RHOB|nr:VOC family protein [Pelagovum pacificum]QQA42137.1 VOC family protein [Pelagovum pacificum]TNY31225.1 VOC family protein [Pelagovum pacificum]